MGNPPLDSTGDLPDSSGMKTETQTRDVDVRDFPVPVLQKIQRLAKASGAVCSAPAALYWAAVQFAKSKADPGPHGDST